MTYINTSDVYNEGIDPNDFPPGRVQSLIILWQQFIEKATGQFFESRSLDFKVDGPGTRILFLQVPIISISALYTNDDFDTAIDTDTYEAYNRTPYDSTEDDRLNPRIVLVSSSGTSIFQPSGSGIFVKGRMNQRLVGDFGYLENGDTPELIKRALLKLVVNTLAELGDPSSSPVDPLAQFIKEEKTDGHMIKYASLFETVTPKRLDYLDIVGDAEVNGILKLFRAPRVVDMIYSDEV